MIQEDPSGKISSGVTPRKMSVTGVKTLCIDVPDVEDMFSHDYLNLIF